MSTTEVPDVEMGDIDTSLVMHRLAAELNEIAAEIGRLSAIASPTMEFLEASRAIQSALVSLSNWDESHDEKAPKSGADSAMPTLSDAWIAFGPHEPWDRVRPTPLDV